MAQDVGEKDRHANFSQMKTVLLLEQGVVYRLKGEHVFLDPSALDMNVLLVVSPKVYKGHILKVDSDVFLDFINAGFTLGDGEGSESYFKSIDASSSRTTINENGHLELYGKAATDYLNELAKDVDRACSNNEAHGTGDVHDFEHEGAKGCHGSLGDSGNCSNTNDVSGYSMACAVIQTLPGSEPKERCIAKINCYKGYGQIGDSGLSSRGIEWRASGSNASSVTVGRISNSQSVYVVCGDDRIVLNCPD